MNIACPALMIAAPSSGQGKTTVTAALAVVGSHVLELYRKSGTYLA